MGEMCTFADPTSLGDVATGGGVMADNRVIIELIGALEDGGNVRLGAFIAQLEAVKSALKQTERLVTGDEESTVYYRVVDLRHSSPATVVLEAVSSAVQDGIAPLTPRRIRQRATGDNSNATVSRFFNSLKQIRRKEAPPRADLQALESYRNLTSALGKTISGVRIINTHESVQIDDDFRNAIDDIIGPDELVAGSVIGMLERVNLHNTARFDIFPTIGPRQIACDFKASLRNAVIAALDRYVSVRGTLRYKRLEDFPYAINADDIEVLPPSEDLPSVFDLRGMAPDIAAGRTAEEFLRGIRDGENW
jgi:hypothetical protein